jgi:hypothetical protein
MKLSLFLIYHHTMKMCVGLRVYLLTFLTSALDESHIHTPTAYLQGKSLQYPLDRSLGGPQNWSRLSKKREKNLCIFWESNPSHIACSQSLTD